MPEFSEFNKFSEAFDHAVQGNNVEAAASAMVSYVIAHSRHTGMDLQQSFGITQSWMGYDGGQHREVSTRNTPQGQQAITAAAATVAESRTPLTLKRIVRLISQPS